MDLDVVFSTSIRGTLRLYKLKRSEHCSNNMLLWPFGIKQLLTLGTEIPTESLYLPDKQTSVALVLTILLIFMSNLTTLDLQDLLVQQPVQQG